MAEVHPDYHIEVQRVYYPVPCRLSGTRVDVRLTPRCCDPLCPDLGSEAARASERGVPSTRDAHRPHTHIAVKQNLAHGSLIERPQLARHSRSGPRPGRMPQAS